MTTSPSQPIRVALFMTCLADWMRPRVAQATVKVLTALGCEVVVPEGQTCCAQPAFNSGDRTSTLAVAKKTLEDLQGFDYVVIPSGSCTGMINHHYPELFASDPATLAKVHALRPKVFEFCQFLVKVLEVHSTTRWPTLPAALLHPAQTTPTLTYHDSCSGLRELGIKQEPRLIIDRIQQARTALGIIESTVPLTGEEDCCGFGGAFAAKYGEISSAIAGRKCEAITASGASAVVLGDLGCILNIEGKLRYEGKSTRVLHIAEYLAG